VKLSLKILGPFYAVLVLICISIGLWTRCGIIETIESTVFVLIAFSILIVLPAAWLSSRRPWLRNVRLAPFAFSQRLATWGVNLPALFRRPPPVSDPQLGELRFPFGFDYCLWRGAIALVPGKSIPLAIAGNADGPDSDALSIARDLVEKFPSWSASIEKALYEHYEPYGEALASGELKHKGDPLPNITKPSDVWPLISWIHVSVAPLGGGLVTEIGLTVLWDEEHTLGARFEAGKFLELCGSV